MNVSPKKNNGSQRRWTRKTDSEEKVKLFVLQEQQARTRVCYLRWWPGARRCCNCFAADNGGDDDDDDDDEEDDGGGDAVTC